MPNRRVLFDTNVLLRASSPGDPQRLEAIRAIATLQSAGASMCICAQNMQEFRQVATRPQAANGLGMSSADVAAAITDFEVTYHLVPDGPAVYQVWRRIVEATGALGRANYDARIVAVAEANGIDTVLTYEAGAFKKYADVTGIQMIDPAGA